MMLALYFLVSVPSIQDTIIPSDYLVCGSFLTGVREGSWRNLPDDSNFVPKEGDSLFSELATGGWVKWRKIKVDSTGWLSSSYENVDWEFLQDLYGISALYNTGYAYTEFEVNERTRALAIALGTSFTLNKQSYPGDVYAHGYAQIPVVLEKGLNKLWLYLGGAGDDRVCFKLIPVDSDVRLVASDATLPELVYGRANTSPLYGAIPVCNTTEDWLFGSKLIVGGGEFEQDTFELPPIAPMSFYKAPFDFVLKSPLPDSVPEDRLMLHASIVWNKGNADYELPLHCSIPTKPHEATFVSAIDSSVQLYAIMEPFNYDSSKTYNLVLGLHGAGSKGLWHLGLFKAKDWAFFVGPNNRRNFGFDWQDWGRLDAIEVYHLSCKTYPIDPDRVSLTGHSMGGHGTWHIALTYPDLFSCASPAAGWTNHELYSPWTWQKSAILAEPWQLEVRNQALRGDNQLARIENACNLPFFIHQGGADDNVPAFQARLYAKRLNQLDYDYVYHEWPGGGHGWIEVFDGDTFSCGATPPTYDFFKNNVRKTYPEHVYYRTADLTQNDGAYWLRIFEVKNRMADAVIEGWLEDDGYRIKTANINRFSLKFDDKHSSPFKIKIDDTSLRIDSKADSVVFELSKNDWRIAKSMTYPHPHPPIKGAYYEPFILVYGTRADSATTRRLLSMARNESTAWWYRANGRVMIAPDTSVDKDMMERFNLILFGSAAENSITAAFESRLPVKIDGERFVFDGEKLPPEALSALFVFPNPLSPKKKILVREGIGEEGLKLSGYFSTLYSGAGLPDYIVWSKDVYDKGWGGVVKAGFFDADWTP